VIGRVENRTAILLAMFGTSVEQALPGLLNIRAKLAAAYPGTIVRIAFTSKIIGKLWRERAATEGYSASHPEVPKEILHIREPAEVMHELAGEGITSLVIQPVHMAPVRKDTNPLAGLFKKEGDVSLFSFNTTAVGRPALGRLGSVSYPYREDIAAVVRSLGEDAAFARRSNAALFYMGHGNIHAETQEIYGEVVAEMRRQYPEILIVMSMVEGSPSVGKTISELKSHRVKSVVIKPFMIVAGDHVRKEMIGCGSTTLQSLLEKEGFTVIPVVKGLGEITAFADIFVQHAADAARDDGIELH